VTDYVRDGVNAPSDFDAPDNLALDQLGNLYIAEDPGGTAPAKTTGDDVWFAPRNTASAAQSLPIRRFFSITDCNAEPTGVYVSPSGKTLFVNIQHRGGTDSRDLSVAISRIKDASFNRRTR
jgi:secreted PhoX family phosphatase